MHDIYLMMILFFLILNLPYIWNVKMKKKKYFFSKIFFYKFFFYKIFWAGKVDKRLKFTVYAKKHESTLLRL